MHVVHSYTYMYMYALALTRAIFGDPAGHGYGHVKLATLAQRVEGELLQISHPLVHLVTCDATMAHLLHVSTA